MTTQDLCISIFYTKNSEALDAFKIFKVEEEKQKENKIRIVRSDRGGKYYGRYIEEKGNNNVHLQSFFKRGGIISQYIMAGTPQQNGVAERRNHTLMDMVRSMINNTRVLPMFLWSEALKIVVYILNRVPSKAIPIGMVGNLV